MNNKTGINKLKFLLRVDNISMFLDLKHVIREGVNFHELCRRCGYNYTYIIRVLEAFEYNQLVIRDKNEGERCIYIKYTEKGKKLCQILEDIISI